MSCTADSFAAKKNMNVIIKLMLTALIGLSGVYPYITGAHKPTAIDEVFKYGIGRGLAVMVFFFSAIALYCISMQTTLERIAPQNRRAKPKSVWWMFVIPYNIIEDFFIIDNLSKSIEQEAGTNPKLAGLRDYGYITGIGWAIAQVMSFIPNEIGTVAGIFGLLLWIRHWLFIRKVNRLLA